MDNQALDSDTARDVQSARKLLIIPTVIAVHKYKQIGGKTEFIPDKSFTTSYEEKVLRLVNEVAIQFDGRTIPARAMWDTGANLSCLISSFARRIRIRQRGQVDVGGASGIVTTPRYIASIILPGGMLIDDIELAEVDFEYHDFDIIIGMDIISRGNFAVKNDGGKTSFSFTWVS